MTASESRDRLAVVCELAEGANDTLVESLDPALLLLADLWLRLDNVPQLQNILLDLLDVGWSHDGVGTGHLLNVGLELPDVLTNDLLVDDVALLRDLGVRSSGEGDCKIESVNVAICI